MQFSAKSLIMAATLSAMLALPASAGVIDERQEAMKAVGGAIKKLAAIAKGQMDFDAGVVKSSAMTIKSSLETASSRFPEGSGEESGIKTRANPEIWLDEEGFAKAMKNAIAAAENMASVTKGEDFMPALGQLGSACKNCHKTFRAPEK